MYTRSQYIKDQLPIEKELKQIFNLREDLVIFDIGSCECEDSIRYAKLFPNSHVFAFEALSSNVKIAQELIAASDLGDRITLINTALSNEIKHSKFYVSSGQPQGLANTADWNYGNKSSSLYPPSIETEVHYPWLNFNQTIEVKTQTLFQVCKDYRIEKIDYIHIDVQGAELNVLEGAKDLIYKVKVIWMEVESVMLYENQPLKNDVENFMKAKGFFKLKDTVDTISGDQLYLNTRYYLWTVLRSEIKSRASLFVLRMYKALRRLGKKLALLDFV